MRVFVYMVGSSILPVAIWRGKLYFLFGKENELEKSARGFSDFGGGMETGETALDTAYREGGEELTGFLGDIRACGRLLPLGDPTQYNIHILALEYDEKLPQYYNNNHRFLWDRMDHAVLSKTKLFEKIEIQWFSVADIRRRMREFRPFYGEILKTHILPAVGKIRAFARGRRRRRTTRRPRRRSGGQYSRRRSFASASV